MTPDTIAHYRITSKLGEGGMGAVYRATDTKLNRDVAIKVIPDSFVQDPDRMTRFAREAQVLASLNHPNIAVIHGVEERSIVMELVEGETLKGPLSLEQALPIIHQLIDALEYAHEKGVVHRDLKPANIKITPEGRVKVLDFGLAKAMSSDPPAGDPAASPTLTMRATMTGVIMGTAAYMAPEQARGHAVDKRADIWSFGVVVYEILTGRTLFEGPSVSDTLAAVLTREPDFTPVPAQVRRLVRACLVRDVRQRIRDIGDARLLLDDTGVALPAKAAPLRIPWMAAGAAVIAAAVLGALLLRATRPVDRPLLHLPVDLGADAILGLRGTVAISPDGSRIAYPAHTVEGKQVLATRMLNQPKGSVLAGTEEATLPFFSPDGQWIGFFAESKLKKISVLGGGAVVLCDAPGGRGASWGDDGFIIATLNNIAGLSRIPDSGGEPKPVTKPADKAELSHRWPHVLPGAEMVLFSANKNSTDWDQANVEALSLRSGERKTVQRGGYSGRYLPSGHLIYIHEGILFGVLFDPVRMEAKGNPVPLVQDIAGHAPSGGGQFDFSRNGTLVYLSGKPEASRYPFGWMAAGGKVEPFAIPPGVYAHPRLSPDGQRLAFSVANTGEVRVFDFARETSSRISSAGLGNRDPVWTRDGKHLAYSGYANDERVIWWMRADGSGEPQRLLQAKGNLTPYSFSPDGGRLAFYDERGISMLPLDLTDPDHPKPGKPETFLATSRTGEPAFSPDGHWIAYMSQESGTFEAYVRPFSGAPAKWLISSGGAKNPVWSRGGRQLFYATPDNHLMVVDYTAGSDSFSPSKPRRWSEYPIGNATGLGNFDVSLDGKRIVAAPVTERDEVKGNLHLTFLINFFDEVKRRIP